MEKKDIKSMDLEELTQELLAMGEKKFRAGQIYGWMHVHLVRSIDEMTNISQKLREQLKENYAFTAVKLLERQISRIDGTQKFLFRLAKQCLHQLTGRLQNGLQILCFYTGWTDEKSAAFRNARPDLRHHTSDGGACFQCGCDGNGRTV